MYMYMDNLLCAAQGDPAQKQRVSNLTIPALKEIFPSLPDKVKDKARFKGIGQGQQLGEFQGDPGMSNQHSPEYPRPVLQTTSRAPLPYDDTHHPALHIG